VFLRGLIEAVSFDWVDRHGHAPNDHRVRSMAEWRLQICLELVGKRGHIPSLLMKSVFAIVRRANDIIHRKRAVEMLSKMATLRAIRDVVNYSERLT
jgi:hypothetical protein